MTAGRRAATLPVAFFQQDVVTVARGLLGRVLLTEFRGCRTAGRIVETEAYLGAEDPASHGYRLRRHAHNQSLYLPPGSWYVYLSYGIHWCANLVAGPPGVGAAVLLRAIEPLEGLEAMRRRRGRAGLGDLASGPGRLCQALGISRARLDGRFMPDSAALVLDGEGLAAGAIDATPRIGLTKAVEWPLRFLVRESPWTSGKGKKRAGGRKGHPPDELV